MTEAEEILQKHMRKIWPISRKLVPDIFPEGKCKLITDAMEEYAKAYMIKNADLEMNQLRSDLIKLIDQRNQAVKILLEMGEDMYVRNNKDQ